MNKKTVLEQDVFGKRVIHRVAYDVPLKEVNGKMEVSDDIRIKATIPTLNYLLENKSKIILLSWLKRPKGKVVEEWRMDPVAKRLSEILNKRVKKVDSVVGKEVEKEVFSLKVGEILMLENVRFHPGEISADDKFAKKLASLGEVKVQDAFAQVHRIHASITGIPKFLPTVAGLYLEKEVDALTPLVTSPGRPFIVIIGGGKISDKIDAIGNLIKIADYILVGGGAANTFMKGLGYEIGNSFLEDVFVDKAKKEKKDFTQYARDLIKAYPQKIILPVDFTAGDDLQNPHATKLVKVAVSKNLVAKPWALLDIGPDTVKNFILYVKSAKTIFWNGPLGVFEDSRFAQGTEQVALAVAKNRNITVLGGGDTIAAARKFKLENSFTHISLAGGVTLEFLAGKKLPGIEAIMDKD
ncbi:phosphoglycerate kinase [Candidatus Gottesmanbacteria bacterium]|nr:phosphoglycerate kinase [Candidatus Gottesmanbacteria bacterium]